MLLKHAQLKLLTTAIFSILFFKHSLSSAKWFSLVLLTIGVAIVQLDTTDTSGGRSKAHHLAAAQDPRKGFAAILAACISSGLAGAWFEWVLKRPSEEEAPPTTNGTASINNGRGGAGSSSKPSTNTTPSLWARNLQLAVPSLVFSFAGVLLSQPFRQAYQAGGLVAVSSAVGSLWAGFTPLVWAVVLNQALGGLLVALVSPFSHPALCIGPRMVLINQKRSHQQVVREADSVSKGFATSVAIVCTSGPACSPESWQGLTLLLLPAVSTLASALLFGVVPGSLFMIGGGLVISSTVLYSFNQS